MTEDAHLHAGSTEEKSGEVHSATIAILERIARLQFATNHRYKFKFPQHAFLEFPERLRSTLKSDMEGLRYEDCKEKRYRFVHLAKKVYRIIFTKPVALGCLHLVEHFYQNVIWESIASFVDMDVAALVCCATLRDPSLRGASLKAWIRTVIQGGDAAVDAWLVTLNIPHESPVLGGVPDSQLPSKKRKASRDDIVSIVELSDDVEDDSLASRLAKLKRMRDNDLISHGVWEWKQRQLLDAEW